MEQSSAPLSASVNNFLFMPYISFFSFSRVWAVLCFVSLSV